MSRPLRGDVDPNSGPSRSPSRLGALAARLERRGTRPDGSVDPRVVGAALLACYLVFVPTYLAVNLFSVGRPALVLWLPGEAELIPFVPEAEFVYALGYALPLVVLLRIPDARALVRLVVAFLLILVAAYATYLLLPVYLERPDLEVTSLATWLLSLEYKDPSYNHFPSLHVATAVLLYLACRDGLRRPALMAALVAAVAVSTMLVKQHYLVDLVYGAGLAAAAWWAAGRWLAATAPPVGRPATSTSGSERASP